MQPARVPTVGTTPTFVHLGPAPLAPAPALDAVARAAVRRFGVPAPPAAPGAAAGAIDGVVRLAAAGPIVEFPGIAAGDRFDIVKGSSVGPLGIRGSATVEHLDDDRATFQVQAGRFGFKVEVTVDLVRLDDEHVRISSRGSGLPDMSEVGRVVERRLNHAVFEQVGDPSRRTTIDHDGSGRIVIDTIVPTLGRAHLKLERRP